MLNRRLGPPTAQKSFEGEAMTVWLIKWPSSITKQGKQYFATTYPGSDHIFMETAAKRRPVSSTQGRKLLPQIREAIARAQA
jgi:hypothetical protein